MSDASELARQLAARRPTAVIVCEVCGTERTVVVQTGARQSRTCGRRCRDKLLYREKKAQSI